MPELLLPDNAPPARYAYRQSRGSRAAAFLLALAMSGFVLTVLVWMGALQPPAQFAGSDFTAVNLSETRAAAKIRTAAKAAAAAPTAQPPPPRAVRNPVVQPPALTLPSLNLIPLTLIPLTGAEMASADIGKMARPAAGSPGAGSGKTFGPGEGPGGVQLLRAQWYREPLPAELSSYMPRRTFPPGAWATIACRTIAHYHVEDCRELSESPAGSGLSRALRQAAWQFLVRPPRLDGKAQVGAWVSIRFDFIRGEREDGQATPADDAGGAP